MRHSGHIIHSIFVSLLILTGCTEDYYASFRPGSHVFPDFNVVLISLDTLRQDRLGAYGFNAPISPFLDRWSQFASILDDAMAQSATTLTSHRSVFRSKYLFAHKVSGAKPEETIAGILSHAGWTSAAFVDGGKMHHSFGHDVGFDSYDDEGGGFNQIIPKVCQWLDTNQQSKFFLFVHTYDIHSPQNPPAPYDQMFSEKKVLDDSIRRKNPPEFNSMGLDAESAAYISNLYNADIRWTDGQLRKLIGQLQNLNLLSKTIVVVMSDHGESFGERGYFGHHQLYNVQTQVPMIWYIPDVPRQIVDGPVENVDILPTLLKLLDVQTPPDLHGIDLSNVLCGKGRLDPNRNHYSEESHRAIMTSDGYKMILRNLPEFDELYYVPEDPMETDNRVTTNPDRVQSLIDRIESITHSTADELRKPITSGHILLKRSPEVSSELETQLNALGYVD